MNTVELMYKNKYLCLWSEWYYLSEDNSKAEQFDIRDLTRSKEEWEYWLCLYFKRHWNIDDSWYGNPTCMELNYAEFKVTFIL